MAAAILKSEIADKASVKVVEAFVAMNRGLKELCKLAEINDPIRGHFSQHRHEMDRALRLQGHEAVHRHCGLHQGPIHDQIQQFVVMGANFSLFL